MLHLDGQIEPIEVLLQVPPERELRRPDRIDLGPLPSAPSCCITLTPVSIALLLRRRRARIAPVNQSARPHRSIATDSRKGLDLTESNKHTAIYQPKAYALDQVACQRRNGAVPENSMSNKQPLTDLWARARNNNRIGAECKAWKEVMVDFLPCAPERAWQWASEHVCQVAN